MDEATPATRIVFLIWQDLTDRRGLKHEWQGIDDTIKAEILQRWVELAEGVLASGADEASGSRRNALMWPWFVAQLTNSYEEE